MDIDFEKRFCYGCWINLPHIYIYIYIYIHFERLYIYMCVCKRKYVSWILKEDFVMDLSFWEIVYIYMCVNVSTFDFEGRFCYGSFILRDCIYICVKVSTFDGFWRKVLLWMLN